MLTGKMIPKARRYFKRNQDSKGMQVFIRRKVSRL